MNNKTFLVVLRGGGLFKNFERRVKGVKIHRSSFTGAYTIYDYEDNAVAVFPSTEVRYITTIEGKEELKKELLNENKLHET